MMRMVPVERSIANVPALSRTTENDSLFSISVSPLTDERDDPGLAGEDVHRSGLADVVTVGGRGAVERVVLSTVVVVAWAPTA